MSTRGKGEGKKLNFNWSAGGVRKEDGLKEKKKNAKPLMCGGKRLQGREKPS